MLVNRAESCSTHDPCGTEEVRMISFSRRHVVKKFEPFYYMNFQLYFAWSNSDKMVDVVKKLKTENKNLGL